MPRGMDVRQWNAPALEPLTKRLLALLVQIAFPERADQAGPLQATGSLQVASHGRPEQQDGASGLLGKMLRKEPMGVIPIKRGEPRFAPAQAALGFRQVDPDPVPVPLRDLRITGSAQHLRSVEVDNELTLRVFAGLEDRDDPIDVLTGRPDEAQSLGGFHGRDEFALQVLLTHRFLGWRPSDRSAFQEQGIYVLWGPPKQSLERAGFATMASEISGVEQPFAISFNQQGVGVIGRVIDEVGGEPERTDGDGLTVLQIPNVPERRSGRRKMACHLQNASGRLPNQDGNLRPEVLR